VAAVHDEIGPGRTLLLDANGAWLSTPGAIRSCRAFEPYDPCFIRGPVVMDSVETMARVNNAIGYPVAIGEVRERGILLLASATQVRPTFSDRTRQCTGVPRNGSVSLAAHLLATFPLLPIATGTFIWPC